MLRTGWSDISAKVKWPTQTWLHFSITEIVLSLKVSLNVWLDLEVCIYLLLVFGLIFYLIDIFFFCPLFGNGDYGMAFRSWGTSTQTAVPRGDHFCLRTKLSGTGSLLQYPILQCIHISLKGRFLSILVVDLINYFIWLTWANILL